MKDFQKLIKSLKKGFTKPDLLFIPLIFIILLSVLAAFDIYEKGRHYFLSTQPSPLKDYEIKKYPFIKNKYEPQISAHAALIMDKDSGTILYSRNQNFRFSPASTTKIMTSLIGLEYFKLSDILEVKAPIQEGTLLGLYQGQKMTFENLLYAMMLPSANDAASTIAQNYPGGFDNFIKKMNDKAQDLKLPNTHFEDPAGLEDRHDYTTAWELARLTSAALDNKIFAQVVSTPSRLITDTLGNEYFVLNRNKLLGVDGVNGVKTGTTEEAGDVLVTSKNTKGHTIIIIVLRSEDRFADTKALLNLVNEESLTYLSIRP
ncbi:MAG: serine hydrolase [Patescibacteria group bacterium]